MGAPIPPGLIHNSAPSTSVGGMKKNIPVTSRRVHIISATAKGSVSPQQVNAEFLNLGPGLQAKFGCL